MAEFEEIRSKTIRSSKPGMCRSCGVSPRAGQLSVTLSEVTEKGTPGKRVGSKSRNLCEKCGARMFQLMMDAFEKNNAA